MSYQCFTGMVVATSVDTGTTYVPLEQITSVQVNSAPFEFADFTNAGSAGNTERKPFKRGPWDFTVTCYTDFDAAGQHQVFTHTYAANPCTVPPLKVRVTNTNTGASTQVGDAWATVTSGIDESSGKHTSTFTFHGTGALVHTQ